MDNNIPKPVDDCYHVYSDGTRLVVLCDNDEDFIYMMNQLAVAACFCGINILAQVVMRTHFHVIVHGDEDKVQKFAREVKRLIVRRYNRDGLGDYVKDSIDVQVDRIRDEEELRRKIIYVFRNCTEAGYDFLPEDYRWGVGRAYCHEPENKKRFKVADLSYRDACRLFRTRVKLPPEWEYDENKMLVPTSYMDIDYIRKNVFLTPRQFMAFLSVKKKDLAEMEAADARPFLEKKEERKLLREVESLSESLFGQPVAMLPKADRIRLATKIWCERKTISVKQLARLTRNNVDVLKAVLHV